MKTWENYCENLFFAVEKEVTTKFLWRDELRKLGYRTLPSSALQEMRTDFQVILEVYHRELENLHLFAFVWVFKKFNQRIAETRKWFVYFLFPSGIVHFLNIILGCITVRGQCDWPFLNPSTVQFALQPWMSIYENGFLIFDILAAYSLFIIRKDDTAQLACIFNLAEHSYLSDF